MFTHPLHSQWQQSMDIIFLHLTGIEQAVLWILVKPSMLIGEIFNLIIHLSTLSEFFPATGYGRFYGMIPMSSFSSVGISFPKIRLWHGHSCIIGSWMRWIQKSPKLLLPLPICWIARNHRSRNEYLQAPRLKNVRLVLFSRSTPPPTFEVSLTGAQTLSSTASPPDKEIATRTSLLHYTLQALYIAGL